VRFRREPDLNPAGKTCRIGQNDPLRQQPKMPVIGMLRSTSFTGFAHLMNAFRRGLQETGFVEGENVAIEFRAAEGRNARLPALIAELLVRPVAVIVANTASALVAKTMTTTVPIVFTGGTDPVAMGLVASINRPGGNVTGVNFFAGVIGAKRFDLLRQLVPTAGTIGMLVNPVAETAGDRSEVQAAAQAVGQQIIIVDVPDERDFEAAFATLVRHGAGAVLVGSGPFMNFHRDRIVTLAARHGLPASYSSREAVEAGGLMSYGPSQTDAHRQAGHYAGRILKGERPADLPVVQSAKFDLALNLSTARAIGLEMPATLLALANEVIE
jgi:putative ABC transport system substrate-binding protein